MLTAYQVGGTVSAETSIYVERAADNELYQSLLDGELCYAFNSRQMGKSSLLLNVKKRLQADGVLCCFIDLSRIGSVNVTQQQWYAGIVSELWRGFDLPTGKAMFDWWQSIGDLSPSQKLSLFLEELLLQHQPEHKITVFFDEIDSVLSLPFAADDFFSLLRAFYNKRADDNRFKQLTFAFFGVALPSDLVRDNKRSPFNIGKAIKLEGFSFDEALPLASGLTSTHIDSEKVLKRIIFWSNGQPFLTQKLCKLVTQACLNENVVDPQQWLDQLVQCHIIDNWESNDNPEHLKTIRDRLLLDEKNTVQHLSTFLQILNASESGVDSKTLNGFNRLYLTGLVANVANNVVVRTQIYHAVFNKNWVEKQLANCRPYGQKLNLWQQSNKADEQWLLPSADLEAARSWGKDKHLSEDDYQFFTASQDKVSQEIHAWNEQLQSEIEQRKTAQAELKQALQAVELAKGEAVSANNAKTEFLARVSHEVRTHLNSILGISYIGQQQEFNQKGNTPLSRIHRVASYMHGIVNDMLDIDLLEKNELVLTQETFYIDDVIDKLVTVISPPIEDKNLTLQVNYPDNLLPAFIGDPLRLTQLLSNLLTNAIKYTPEGTITLSIKQSRNQIKSQSKNQSINQDQKFNMIFEVSDSGEGIGEVAFEGSLNMVDTQAVTLGIGLKLCQKLANIMQGQLNVKSVPKQGCRFSFSCDFDAPFSLLETESDTRDIALDVMPKHIYLLESSGTQSLVQPLEQQLTLLGHHVVIGSVNDIAKQTLRDVNILIAGATELNSPTTLIPQLNNHPKLQIIPLLKQSENYPHWLTVLGYKQRLNSPCSARHLTQTLQTLYKPAQLIESNQQDLPAVQNKHTATVLVVDDDEINQEIVTELLHSIGVNVDVAENGLAALNAVKAKTYQLVLMDIEMPVMGGEQALQEIKKLATQPLYQHLNNLPIIALTAHALIDDKKKYLLAGMNDYIGKPIEPSLLINVVRQWLPNDLINISRNINGNISSNINNSIKNNASNTLGNASTSDVTVEEEISIEGINTAQGLLRCNGNKALYVKILQQFAQQYTDGLNVDGLVLEGKSSKKAKQFVHSLKGSSANIGASKLSEQASAFEQQLNTTDLFDKKALQVLSAILNETCKNIIAEVDTWNVPKSNNTERDTAKGNESIMQLLNALLLSVDEDHAEAIVLTEELMAIGGDRAVAVENAMNCFDIEQVKVLCQNWLSSLAK